MKALFYIANYTPEVLLNYLTEILRQYSKLGRTGLYFTSSVQLTVTELQANILNKFQEFGHSFIL